MKYVIIFSSIIFLIFVVFSLFSYSNGSYSIFENQKVKVVDSFDKCVDLGFPVMESYPRKCTAGDKTFSEEVKFMQYKDLVRIDSPLPDQVVKSPLVIRGEARGNWYFEASFPAKLMDANGKELISIPVRAKGEWMTTDYVPFETTMIFVKPETSTGTLILKKDNPSGLPENDDEVKIPVKF